MVLNDPTVIAYGVSAGVFGMIGGCCCICSQCCCFAYMCRDPDVNIRLSFPILTLALLYMCGDPDATYKYTGSFFHIISCIYISITVC